MDNKLVSFLIKKAKAIILSYRSHIIRYTFHFLTNEQIRSTLLNQLSKKIIDQLTRSETFKGRIFSPHFAVITGTSRIVNLENNLEQINLFLNTENNLRRPVIKLNPQEKKRILFVTAIFPSTRHAGGLRVFDIIQTLSKNYKISLYSSFNPSHDTESFDLLKDKLEFVRLVNHSFFSDKDLRTWLGGVKTNFLLSYHVWPESSTLLFSSRRHSKISIFEHSEVVTRSYFLELEKIASDTRAYDFRNLAYFFTLSYIAEYIACNLADVSLCLTAADELFVKETFNKKDTYLMPTCISRHAVLDKINSYRPEDDPSNTTAIFLGYYDHTPNVAAVEWFISKALDKVLIQVPNFKLKVVGKGNLENLKSTYSSPSIEWVGEVEDIVPHIQSATICLSPLISGAGFRGKINQYSACKKATVSTSIGVCGLPYTNKKDVLIADTSEDFATQVVLLLKNNTLRKEIEENAFKLVNEHYSWDRTITSFESFLNTYENSMDLVTAIQPQI